MNSIFTDRVDLSNPFPLHPNPYFERENFISLCGWWDFDISNESHIEEYSKRIVVPFSPETPLSQLGISIKKNDFLHYRKEFSISNEYVGKKGLIHFAAVDQRCSIYFNGEKLGEHEGGYTSFSFLINCLKKENTLVVIAEDDTDSEIYARGKQSNERGGIWYTPTSGIWGDVYLEFLPEQYIKSFDLVPDWNKQTVSLRVHTNDQSAVKCRIFHKDAFLVESDAQDDIECIIDLANSFFEWSPDNPNLYHAELICGEDVVRTTFGFRYIESRSHNGKQLMYLNGKPIFLSSLLDQGYWPDGGLTAPSYEAIELDINKTKEAGFNSLRKHIKVESMRWYYECDRKGVIVIQDLVNSGAKYSKLLINTRPFVNYDINDLDNKILGRSSKESMMRFVEDMRLTTVQLKHVTSICVWTLFNEGWGQFRAIEMYPKMRDLVGNCLIDATSGWYDKGVGDFNSRHIYFRAPKPKSDGMRILSLSEFGGYSLPSQGHMFTEKTFGYATYKSDKKLNSAISKVYKRDLVNAIKKDGLSVSVYTQLSDVEDEINGLFTYDRAIFKPDINVIKECNEALYSAFDEMVGGKE